MELFVLPPSTRVDIGGGNTVAGFGFACLYFKSKYLHFSCQHAGRWYSHSQSLR